MPIQRCQIHKARNVIERLPKPLHASVRKALRQAWELDDADKAERLLRNLARRLEHEAPGVAGSILEGIDEMLTVNRLGLPAQLRRMCVGRACAATAMRFNCRPGGRPIENVMGTVRRVCRNGEAMAKCQHDAALDRRRSFLTTSIRLALASSIHWRLFGGNSVVVVLVLIVEPPSLMIPVLGLRATGIGPLDEASINDAPR